MSIEIIADIAKRHPDLRGAHHFEICDEVEQFAIAAALSSVGGPDAKIKSDEFRTSNDSHLPFSSITLSMADGFIFKITEVKENIRVFLFSHSADCFRLLAEYQPGHTIKTNTDASWNFLSLENRWGQASLISVLLAVINTPRIVTAAPAASRQRRRAVARDVGIENDAWHRVTFDLSKKSHSKKDYGSDGRVMPLHWVRGYYRRPLEGAKKNLCQRPDALRPEDRIGWWQWIEPYLAGDPAIGVVKSYHAPRLSTGELATSRAA